MVVSSGCKYLKMKFKFIGEYQLFFSHHVSYFNTLKKRPSGAPTLFRQNTHANI